MAPTPPETRRRLGMEDLPVIILVVLCTLSLVSRVLLLLGR